MADGPAALRGKPEPGAYELRDAVLSAFIKGECNLATDQPLRILKEQMTGRQMGKAGQKMPPYRQLYVILRFSVNALG